MLYLPKSYFGKIYILFLHVTILILLYKTEMFATVFLSKPEFSSTYYETRAFTQRVEKNITHGIVFMGDSLIQGLAVTEVYPYSINLGIGGDTTLGVLNRIKQYKSLGKVDAVFFSIGINDLVYRNDLKIEENISLILAETSKKTPVFINSILPVSGPIRAEVGGNKRVNKLNQAIQIICKQFKNCHFLDMTPYLTDAKGQLNERYHIGDGIHLNALGYDIWIKQLKILFTQITRSKRL